MPHLQNERGQAVIAALVLLPVILSITLGLAILSYALTIEAKATAACRRAMIENQNDAAEALEKLLALNPKAESAERKVKAARELRVAARASANPVAITMAEAAYVGALMFQEIVRGQQAALLIKGQAASKLAPVRATASIHETLPTGIINLKASFPKSGFRSRSGRFHVIASPPGARTPTYRTAPGFTRSQETRAHGLLSIHIRGFDFAPNIELGCSATLTKNGGRNWAPQIIEDKLLSN